MRKIYFLALSIFASVSLMATQVKVAAGTDLQAVVNGASSGDTVLVQAGTYEGNFTMKDGVNVSGGWNEDFTAQTEHASILDANNSGRVLNQLAGFSKLTIWDNFTIQNGKLAAPDGVKNLGAGVALMKKGRVINCLIQNNTFEYSGNCIGGGIGQDVGDRNDTCAINCVVRNNQASHGGGVRIRGVILNSVIEYNKTTTNAAGGLHLQGGAAYNCIIRNNESLNNTGGVRLYGACELVNCLVVGNKAGGKVGGVGCENAPSNIINCTIVGNDQVNTGSDAVFCGLSNAIGDTNQHNGKFFVNNVIWGNTVNGEVQVVQANAHIKRYSTFANNALSDTTDLGKEYIALSAANDPQFDANYECAATSPLYNAGSDVALTYLLGDKDIYGHARKQNGVIEIGAVESVTKYYVAASTDLQAAVDGASSGDTVLVEEGIYEGNFTMKDGVYVSGGWNADFTAQTEHASILDAKANGRVLNQPANFNTLTIWDNFTIQNGKLSAADGSKNLGAGVALMKKGRVINCLIQNNTFEYSGNCLGGGIGQDIGDNKDTCAINCVVRYNKATHGGGVRIRGVILNSLVESNVATKNGGGIYLQGSAAAYNCVILKNTCAEGGGGVDTYGSARMVGCLIAENTAGNVGGIQMRSLNRDTVDSGSDIINCTVVNNKQTNTNNPQFCGVRLDVRNNPSRAFINNVVWGNTVNGEAQTQEIGGYPQGYGTFLNNAFAGTTASVTYIQLNAENDPQFGTNYECAATSPLYNAGSNEALTYLVGDKDVYGNARVQNGAIEIGAVECAMALLADGDNSVVIEANEDMTTNVLLKRTFKANDGYYTICLPFNIEAAKIGQAFQVESILDAGAEGVNVEFREVAELVAGQPYLVLPSKNLTNPVFENVTIKTVSAATNQVDGAGIKVAFTGVINGGGETNGTTEYWVGNGGYLYNDKTAKLGLRAFFTITDKDGNPAKVRARVVTKENAATGLEHITTTDKAAKVIENGQLLIIRDGVKYNAMGVKL